MIYSGATTGNDPLSPSNGVFSGAVADTENIHANAPSNPSLPLLANGEINYSAWLPTNFKPTAFDHWPVPSVPRHRLPGMAFLSPKAANELKHGARVDELLPGDQIELQFIYTRILYEDGDVMIQFPSYYNDAYELKDHPIAKTVGKDCPFFFELGEKLCEIIPEYDWPVPNLIKLLITARNQRFVYLQLKKRHADPSFLSGMTYRERKMYNKLVDCDNTLEKGNRGSISLKSYLDSINYYNR